VPRSGSLVIIRCARWPINPSAAPPSARSDTRPVSGTSTTVDHRLASDQEFAAARIIATMPVRMASGSVGQASMIACRSGARCAGFVSTATAFAPGLAENAVFPGKQPVSSQTENPCVGGSIPPLTTSATSRRSSPSPARESTSGRSLPPAQTACLSLRFAGGRRNTFVVHEAVASGAARQRGENGEIEREAIDAASGSPLLSTAARICRTASPPSPSSQNISVPLTRLLICLTSDSASELVTDRPWQR